MRNCLDLCNETRLQHIPFFTNTIMYDAIYRSRDTSDRALLHKKERIGPDLEITWPLIGTYA